MGYSIWLNFSQPCAQRLQDRIESFSKRNSSPCFQPHLTLLGDMDLGLDEVRKVAEIFRDGAVPCDLPVQDVGRSDRYFMALFLSVEIPATLQLARKQSALMAGQGTRQLDAPHVSLAYGEFKPECLSQDLGTLKQEFSNARLSVGSISIVHSSKTVPISEWKPIETFSLRPQDAGSPE